jgi:hypothetical protein
VNANRNLGAEVVTSAASEAWWTAIKENKPNLRRPNLHVVLPGRYVRPGSLNAKVLIVLFSMEHLSLGQYRDTLPLESTDVR